ncbi:MAG: M28 family peptidase [Planctomycetales bacterium]|nr:M28 family peptidase [Planctomycetales bacterium]
MMRKPDGQTIFLGAATLVLILVSYLAFFNNRGDAESQVPRSGPVSLETIPFDGRQAFRYLEMICEIGPRPSGSPGMVKQQEMLTNHFKGLGAAVELQQFETRHPSDGSRVNLANMIVQWHPERMQRVLLCAHYDTRPFPDQDRRNPRGTFIGANDGGSGVALLMELGRHMRELEGPFGIDFILFDAEEFIFDANRDKYFVGSEYFARQYVAAPPAYRYRAGVLLDMVGDSHLDFYQERNSLFHARSLVDGIWNTANQLGVREFIRRPGYEIKDDHLALNTIARIPTCDVIDFDYPRPRATSYWHTEADTPDKCSPLSLAKVGWVMLEWLRGIEQVRE